MVGWLLLLCGVAILVLGLAPYVGGRGVRFLPAVAAVLGGVVIALAIVRIAD